MCDSIVDERAAIIEFDGEAIAEVDEVREEIDLRVTDRRGEHRHREASKRIHRRRAIHVEHRAQRRRGPARAAVRVHFHERAPRFGDEMIERAVRVEIADDRHDRRALACELDGTHRGLSRERNAGDEISLIAHAREQQLEAGEHRHHQRRAALARDIFQIAVELAADLERMPPARHALRDPRAGQFERGRAHAARFRAPRSVPFKKCAQRRRGRQLLAFVQRGQLFDEETEGPAVGDDVMRDDVEAAVAKERHAPQRALMQI